jgi:helix-turn-helix protein
MAEGTGASAGTGTGAGTGAITVVGRTNVDFIYPVNQEAQPDEKMWTRGGLLTITNTHIRLTARNENFDFPLKSLEDVEDRPVGPRQVLFLTRYINGKFHSCAISAAPKTIESLRRYFVQYISDAFKTGIYYISPASRGGVLVTNPKWERGLLLATQKSIWFMAKEKQIRIGLKDIIKIKRETRKLSGEERFVLAIDHLDNGEASGSLVLCPDSTMDMLEKYLSDLVERYNSLGAEARLSETESQVATLIYSGVDSSTIQSMLGIENNTLEQFYDKLLGLGMAKVARVRRELELTPKGVKYVTDVMSNVNTNVEKK